MVATNRSWPGTSTNARCSPSAPSRVHTKPRSRVSPLRRSSSKRSGSIPVSARTRADLPWSTCPAVARTRMALPPRGRPYGVGEPLVVLLRHRPQVEQAAPRLQAPDHGDGSGTQDGDEGFRQGQRRAGQRDTGRTAAPDGRGALDGPYVDAVGAQRFGEPDGAVHE